MPKDLKKEIENHLATFPERHADVIEMKKEWEEFKSRFFWAIIGSAGLFVAIGVWVGTIQSAHFHIEEEIKREENSHTLLESRVGTLEINNSEIRARLASIETILLEIKADLVKLR
jgi:uncharacterized protein YceH (UPF0502 family)